MGPIFTKSFSYQNGGFPEPYKAIVGVGFPYISRIHTAYIGEDSSILGTWNVWWHIGRMKPENPAGWSPEIGGDWIWESGPQWRPWPIQVEDLYMINCPDYKYTYMLPATWSFPFGGTRWGPHSLRFLEMEWNDPYKWPKINGFHCS